MSAPSRQPNTGRKPLSILSAAITDGLNYSARALPSVVSTGRAVGEYHESVAPMRTGTTFGSPSLSAFDIPDGYTITNHDEEQLKRKLARNATSPSFLPHPSSASLVPPARYPPSNLPAKRALDAPQIQPYGLAEGPPPKKGFFAPPVASRSHHRSVLADLVGPPPLVLAHGLNGIDTTFKRLSQEATKHGVGRLDLSTAAFQGIDTSPDYGDVPKSGQANTTPGYAGELRAMRNVGEGGRARNDSVVGGDITYRDQVIFDQLLHKQTKQQGFLHMKRDANDRRRAVNRGVTMKEVEIGTKIKKLVDTVCSWQGRYSHLHPPSASLGPYVSREAKAGSACAPVTYQDHLLFDVQGTMDKGRAEAHRATLSGNERVFGPLARDVAAVCRRDVDGVYRAPEEEGVCEQRAEVMWMLRMLTGKRGGDWERDDGGDWRRRPEVDQEIGLLGLHVWAALP